MVGTRLGHVVRVAGTYLRSGFVTAESYGTPKGTCWGILYYYFLHSKYRSISFSGNIFRSLEIRFRSPKIFRSLEIRFRSLEIIFRSLEIYSG